jgi:hypothetical protein
LEGRAPLQAHATVFWAKDLKFDHFRTLLDQNLFLDWTHLIDAFFTLFPATMAELPKQPETDDMDISDDEKEDRAQVIKYGKVSVATGTDHGIGGLVEEGGKKIHDLTGHETPSSEEPLDPELWEVDYTNTRLTKFPSNILPLQKLEVRIKHLLFQID